MCIFLNRKEVIRMAEKDGKQGEKQEQETKKRGKCGCGCAPQVKK
jgi:hypothetical protein